VTRRRGKKKKEISGRKIYGCIMCPISEKKRGTYGAVGDKVLTEKRGETNFRRDWTAVCNLGPK